MVEEKSNEITAVPKLLNLLQIKGMTVSADAMSTQTDIVAKIISKKADYVLAVKENQKSLYQEVKGYLSFPEFQEEMKAQGHYLKTEEWAHSQWECREYFQTKEINWLLKNQSGRWKGLKSNGMVRTTITREDRSQSVEERYYISSLDIDLDWFSKVVRGHLGIERMHWQLDVVFREDANQTLDKTAAQNLNNLRKLCLSILSHLEMGKRLSDRRKRFRLMLELPHYLEQLFRL
jgi:predicted transposase YbfD/YdcC